MWCMPDQHKLVRMSLRRSDNLAGFPPLSTTVHQSRGKGGARLGPIAHILTALCLQGSMGPSHSQHGMPERRSGASLEPVPPAPQSNAGYGFTVPVSQSGFKPAGAFPGVVFPMAPGGHAGMWQMAPGPQGQHPGPPQQPNFEAAVQSFFAAGQVSLGPSLSSCCLISGWLASAMRTLYLVPTPRNRRHNSTANAFPGNAGRCSYQKFQ